METTDNTTSSTGEYEYLESDYPVPLSLSIIIPTVGKHSLWRTLDSMREQEILPGDEILIVADGEHFLPAVNKIYERYQIPQARTLFIPGPNHDWGHSVRNYLQDHEIPKGDYIVSMDDDDVFMPGAFHMIRESIAENYGRPLLFRIWFNHEGSKTTMWGWPEVLPSVVGTLNLVYPNRPGYFGRWGNYYGGDFQAVFETIMHYGHAAEVFVDKFIAMVRPWQYPFPQKPK